MTQIAPSILAADFAHLANDIDMINRSEADWLHYDVMDGQFVPNISFGMPVLASIAKIAAKPIDVHLMVQCPEQWIEPMSHLGVRMYTVHLEASPNLHRTVQRIHEAGMLAGVAINPATPVSMLEEIISDIDMVLVMSVNPGFGGQKFIESSVDKVRRTKELIVRRGAKAIIEVDGGVNLKTGAELVAAGADLLVAGNSVFAAPDPVAMIHSLKQL
jgi:ribulose-phosphate 3-epimerase